MPTIKLSITSRKALARKYDPPALARIADAVKAWIAADSARGITTVHVALDDPAAMTKYGVPAITGRVTASRAKVALDALVAKLGPDYIVLFGATDVIPSFAVTNPARHEDDEPKVVTDNPYASSRKYSARKNANYLIPDRVLGRIPDLPHSSDPAWLLDYLSVATAATSKAASHYASRLLVCADTWKGAGQEAASFIGSDPSALMLSPPVVANAAAIRAKHGAALHMIKCHGAPMASEYYGQRGNSYPEVVHSPEIVGRTRTAAIVGAMCCYGASVFDPDDPRSVHPGEPPIPSVYLRQGAFGFCGATTTAWVGGSEMMCADRVVAEFLKAVLDGASVGLAMLKSKQTFAQWVQQQGHALDSTDEKTLLQYVLLGDPSIHPVEAATPARAVVAGPLRSLAAGSVMARRTRRDVAVRLATTLREAAPRVTPAPRAKVPARLDSIARQLLRPSKGGRGPGTVKPRVERIVHTPPRSEGFAVRAALSAGSTGPRTTLQYYWASKRHVRIGRKATIVRVPEIRVVSIQTDASGNIIRTKLVVSS